MLSLRQSIKHLDETEALNRAAARAFAEAVETSAEHVVEVNRHDAAAFREQVLNLAERVGTTDGTKDLAAAHDQFRGELRSYSKKASENVSRLREELQAAAVALQSFAEGVSGPGEEHAGVLKKEFMQLRSAADAALHANDVRQVRAAVHTSLDRVAESFDALQRSHSLVITAMRDEIRVLHAELERGQQKPSAAATEAMSEKRSLDKTIEDLLSRRVSFEVVLLGMPDRRELCERYPEARVDTALADLGAAFGKLAHPARPAPWTTGTYAVATTTAVAMDEWRSALSLCHVFQHEGIPRTLKIEPRLERVRSNPGESPTAFFSRLSEAVRIAARPH